MSNNTIEVIDRGMACLSENLGAAETERFITCILRERFDYTTWHQRLADSVTEQKLRDMVSASEASDPFKGTATVV